MVRLVWIDQLVESGLCDRKKLPYARIVLSDVNQGIKSMVYRDLAVTIFSKITDLILNDQILYQRLRQLLAQQYHEDLDKILGRETGTDELLNYAIAMTPGQSKTWETIKKVVKDVKEVSNDN